MINDWLAVHERHIANPSPSARQTDWTAHCAAARRSIPFDPRRRFPNRFPDFLRALRAFAIIPTYQ
jgi:hypothetical protein